MSTNSALAPPSTTHFTAGDSGSAINKRGPKPDRTCQFCQKFFSKSEHLKRHLRSHTKERPYLCSTCGKSYSRSDTLVRHQLAHAKTVKDGSLRSDVQDSPSHGSQHSSIPRQEEGYVPSHGSGRLLAEDQPRHHRQPPLHQMTRPAVVFSSLDTEQRQPPVFPGETLSDPSLIEYTNPTTTAEPAFGTSLQEDAILSSQYFGQPNQDFLSASWLLAEDFDVNALDNALAATMSDWVQIRPYDLAQSVPATQVLPISPPSMDARLIDTRENRPLGPATAVERQSSDLVSKQWFTRLPTYSTRVQSRAGSEAPDGQFHVNEQYRNRLSRTLAPRFTDPAIPSAEHLNLYLRLYVSNFHPMLPVIHLPTFRANSQNSHLLLSMCSLGSLFIQYPAAAIQGRGIFDRVHKVLLASWETHLFSNKREALAMVQTALLGQTYGMLSGRAKDLAQTDAFHGTLLAWARALGPPNAEPFVLPTHDISEDKKDRLWKEWVLAEQQIRLSIAVLIHDAEIASLLHLESTTRRSIFGRLPRLPNDNLFDAPTAKKWYTLLRNQPTRTSSPFPTLRNWMNGDEDQNPLILQSIQDSRFELYSMLECINVAIIEAGQANTLGGATILHFQKRLMIWYELNSGASVNYHNGVDPFHTMILWHSTFMSLFADFDLLEAAVGRDGHELACGRSEEMFKWASSPHATRCLIHCFLLQDEIEGMQLRSEPALHVPRTAFWAGLVALCNLKSSNAASYRPPDFQVVDFPEIVILGGSARTRIAEAFAFSPGPASVLYTVTVCKFIDQLQKLGRWGISRTFAQILSTALQETGDAAAEREDFVDHT